MSHENMERVTLRMPKEMVRQLEVLAEEGMYPNRSAVIRSYVREGLENEDIDPEEAVQKYRRRIARI